MRAKVEITKYWDGIEVVKETVVSGADRSAVDEKAAKWVRENAPDPKNIAPYWTLTLKGTDKTEHLATSSLVIDYGSHVYFGRVTILQSGSPSTKPAAQIRNKTMSKKKPYSRVENGKTLRKIENELKRDAKTLAKLEAPAWYVRLREELNVELTKLVKLRDYLWVKDTKDSEVRVSDEAKAICPKALKLLLKQEKVMTTFCDILDQRLGLGWPKTPGVCECKKGKKADAKKSVKKAK